jgi:uncharacterized membrane protein YgdD (TMEM256/DUF423 family)
MATWQMCRCVSTVTLSVMDAAMNLFGPWLVPLFGVGAVLLVGGLVTREMASDRSVKGLGRGAANVGWRLMLLAAAM